MKMVIPKAWIFSILNPVYLPLSHAASTITTTTNKQKQNLFFKGCGLGGWGVEGLEEGGGGGRRDE